MAYRRDYRRGRRTVPKKKGFFGKYSLNNILIGINVIVFVAIWPFLVFGSQQKVLEFIAINPQLFFGGYVWTLITSIFMHGGFGHLFVNMISMFFIGNFVERLIGRKRFLWFYMISGIVAGLAFVSLAYFGQDFSWGTRVFGGINTFAVGASGALFGLGGLLAVLIPRMKVLVMFIIPAPMWLAMAVLMFGLWIVSAASGLPVGNTAHLGGLVVGLVYGFYLRGKYPRKIRMLNRMIGV